ncbi:unnamed protein product [Paramecium sonneborni]|uniref:Protein kinase domain-containing protein n=1 Tax=Paramecium sonneborni TaxID=65129 RepID=A0A8S1N045_9CILI|nr:unnamed protein product [Paramecium sonneborni]
MKTTSQTQYKFDQSQVSWKNIHYKFIDKLQQKQSIFLAQDLKNNARQVIIKQINNSSKKYQEREKEFTQELIKQAKFSYYNPYVVQYYDLFEEDESIFIVMEKCDSDLEKYYQQKMEEKSNINYAQVLNIFQHIVHGYQYLYYLFGPEFQHRDIKPSNILILEGKHKICDFGFSKNSLDNPTKYVGTLNFQAPEIFRNCLYDNKCDIYSLGILLLWLLTGSTFKENIQKLDFNFSELVKSMVDDDPNQRIGWNTLFRHPAFVQKPEIFLNIKRDNNTSISLHSLAQLFDNQETDISFATKVNTSFIKNNCIPQFELNKLISDTFKHVDKNNIELSRILFALWIKYYDRLILIENDQKRRDEYHKQKVNIQRQQLFRIKNQVDYRIEFLSLNELCRQLLNHLEHFNEDSGLQDRLKDFLKNSMKNK